MITIIHLLNDIGLGHCKRMQIYANRLVKEGHKILFFIQKSRDDHFRVLESFGTQIIQYDDEDSIDIQFELINMQIENSDHINWVIDTKNDCSDWIVFIKNMAIPVTLFDNPTDARLLADQNIYPTPLFDRDDLDWEAYRGIVRSGWDELLLSESIVSLKETIDEGKRNHVLVTFGGTDPNEITLKVMTLCAKISIQVPIKIVVGPSFKHHEKIKNLNQELGARFQLIEDCNDLSEYIANAKCVITAVGVTIFEAHELGVGTIVISNYETDDKDERKLNDIKNIHCLGNFKHVEKDALMDALEVYLA